MHTDPSQSQFSWPLASIWSEVALRGFCFAKGLNPRATTHECAIAIGRILDVERLAPQQKIPNVQVLSLVDCESARPNSYSSEFGRGEFPLHTDYAQWLVPPRYFLLRCLHGDIGVSTRIAQWSLVCERSGSLLKRAVVAPRRKHPAHAVGVLPVAFSCDGGGGFRWDSLFLRSLNDAAERVQRCIESLPAESMEAVNLSQPGDTLVLDNWRVLHGRSAADSSVANRRIERVYLEELKAR